MVKITHWWRKNSKTSLDTKFHFFFFVYPKEHLNESKPRNGHAYPGVRRIIVNFSFPRTPPLSLSSAPSTCPLALVPTTTPIAFFRTPYRCVNHVAMLVHENHSISPFFRPMQIYIHKKLKKFFFFLNKKQIPAFINPRTSARFCSPLQEFLATLSTVW